MNPTDLRQLLNTDPCDTRVKSINRVRQERAVRLTWAEMKMAKVPEPMTKTNQTFK
jgi:hypothetical protein